MLAYRDVVNMFQITEELHYLRLAQSLLGVRALSLPARVKVAQDVKLSLVQDKFSWFLISGQLSRGGLFLTFKVESENVVLNQLLVHSSQLLE
jgi:hypothetical protein